MKCSIQGCPGEYEDKTIIHTVKHGDDVFVFNHVPAEVCTICGDTLLKPGTVQHIEDLLAKENNAERMVPLYEYA